MPTELQQGVPKPDPIMDRETSKMVADYFESVEKLNPQRIQAQAGWYDRDHYVVHIRFKDLAVPAKTGGMKLYYTCEHMLDVPLTNAKLMKAVGRPMQRGDLALWLLGDRIRISGGVFDEKGALPDTLEMAYAEFVLERKRTWPHGFPLPRSQRSKATSH